MFDRGERSRRRRDWILRLGKDSRPAFNHWIAKYSLVGDPSVFDPGFFPWTATLEAGWEGVRKEAEAVLARRRAVPLAGISPDHQRIAPGDGWKSFMLYGYGYRSEANCAECPHTTRLLGCVPGLETAFFSVLEPGGFLKRHRGVTKAIITTHLGLILPRHREDCMLRVKKRVLTWREGKVLMFDDTRKHDVWNMTDEPRVVLLMQVRRPVRFPGNLASSAFLSAVRHSPFIRDARRNQAALDSETRAKS